jgi:hypothetical protein
VMKGLAKVVEYKRKRKAAAVTPKATLSPAALISLWSPLRIGTRCVRPPPRSVHAKCSIKLWRGERKLLFFSAAMILLVTKDHSRRVMILLFMLIVVRRRSRLLTS